MTTREQVSRRSVLGPLAEPFPDVRSIVVLRGGGLGDLLFAMPAVHALAATYPDAQITLLGSPVHAELLGERPGPVAEVIPLPAAEHEAAFSRDFARRRPDLGVQLHGGGAWSNPFLTGLGPRWTVGPRAADAGPLTRTLPFRYYQHEMLRWLEVTGLAGAAPVVLEPELEVTGADLLASEAVLQEAAGPVVALHPGATDPRRRWPPDRFADVAAHCVARGAVVLVLGAESERPLVEEVCLLVRRRTPQPEAVRSMIGASMSALCGVLARSTLFLGNDSGPRHLARAVGTPTVGIYWIGNVVNAGPLVRTRDRVLASWMTNCPVCHADLTDETLPRCPHDDSVVTTVRTEQVCAEVDDLLAAQG
ncbi:ADP-heptose--LPS heptosyltransferase 2 [Nocardia farcinica]|uniref:ADP-heptose--LPS heptosyltransferase 2 n=1 Tax=Nocardia farcinica TaxID=37329 RepID=A0A449HCP4_NOCFR|nr:glycosyltransferase family 9 protein [Nocardia farcinica]VFA95743.1 ADP-heptose--LPS heptosyltransferase 2 [Nocardia farcinica]